MYALLFNFLHIPAVFIPGDLFLSHTQLGVDSSFSGASTLRFM